MDIGIYAHWKGLSEPLRLGLLRTDAGADRELFSFAFDRNALNHPDVGDLHLDPHIGLFEGRQYPAAGHSTFGVFSDATPDRWGRMLMRRRQERLVRSGKARSAAPLVESDYLLGVHDSFRIGALRFRRNDVGEFMDAGDHMPAPPFVRLRELEAASAAIERDEDNADASGDEWLRMLIAPGGSLGGARPKASVQDPDGHLWIAKFPSLRDPHDVGVWEVVMHSLARACGIRTPSSRVQRFAHDHHTFLVKRFDRTESGERLHFASAMTLTGRTDGDDASSGASYLDLVDVIVKHGDQTINDLQELWLRIVFNMCVSNADDHLRNHGFLLVPGKGWRLSEAYDMNPDPSAHALKLNVSRSDNAMDLDLARSVAPEFRLSVRKAETLIEQVKDVVRQWQVVADSLKIPEREQRKMGRAFRLAM